MKLFIMLLSLIQSINLFAQERKEIITADVVSFKSKMLKEERTAWVYNPGNKKESTIYPVIYVLDGETHFKSVVAMVEYLSNANVIPQMIVVGILHKSRMRDLTPTIEDTIIDKHGKSSGGGEKFMSFIKSELFPAIQSKYSVAPYQILIGHSVGGLTVMNTLIHHKDLFNAYVSIDASLWWDKHLLLNESKAALTVNNYADKKLFLAIANRMEKGIDTIFVQDEYFKLSEKLKCL